MTGHMAVSNPPHSVLSSSCECKIWNSTRKSNYLHKKCCFMVSGLDVHFGCWWLWVQVPLEVGEIFFFLMNPSEINSPRPLSVGMNVNVYRWTCLKPFGIWKLQPCYYSWPVCHHPGKILGDLPWKLVEVFGMPMLPATPILRW